MKGATHCAYPRSAFSGQKHFVIPAPARARIESLPRSCRNKGALKVLLQALGQHSMDSLTDGAFDVGVIPSLSLDVNPRTALARQFPRLVASGAVVHIGQGRYRILDFHLCNPSADHVRACVRKRQAYWEGQRQRNSKIALANMATSWQPQPQENPDITGIHPVSPQVEPTEPTPPAADLSATNPDTQLGLSAELAAVIAKAEQSAQRHAEIHAVPEEEIAAVERELMGQAALPAARATRPPKYPTRLARKPKLRTPINEHFVTTAMEHLGVSPSSHTRHAWWADLLALGVCGEDLEYAVREVKRQKSKQRIHDPLAYAQKIVLSQARARYETLT